MSDWALLQGIMRFIVEVGPDFTKVIGVTGIEWEFSEIIKCDREVFSGIPNPFTYINDSCVAFTNAWDPQASWSPTKDEPALPSSPERHRVQFNLGVIIVITASAMVVVAIVEITPHIGYS